MLQDAKQLNVKNQQNFLSECSMKRINLSIEDSELQMIKIETNGFNHSNQVTCYTSYQ